MGLRPVLCPALESQATWSLAKLYHYLEPDQLVEDGTMRTLLALVMAQAVCTLAAAQTPTKAPPTAENSALQQPSEADWWSVQKFVTQQLFSRDVGVWARELEDSPSREPVDLMVRFCVLNRAGHHRHVREVIDAMADVDMAKGQLTAMAEFLIGREEWLLARYFLEKLPQAEPGWSYVLIKHWAENGGNPDEIDHWLVDRGRDNPEYWFRERLRFRRDQKTADALVEELAGQVRKQPQDADAALQYLEAVRIVGLDASHVDWLADVSRPKLAYDSYRLGNQLHAYPQVAIPILEHSLETPFTEQDGRAMDERLRYAARAWPATKSTEEQLREWTKYSLMTSLQEAGQAAKAQPLLEELTRSNPGGIPSAGLAPLAGQIQAASGARVVEGRIRQAEPEKKDNPQYWLSRAGYYAGRREHEQAVEAYLEALRLAKPDPEDLAASHRGGIAKSWVVRQYANYLQRAKGAKAAAEMLSLFLSETQLDSTFAHWVARAIMDLQINHPREMTNVVDEDLLWRYLAARPAWDHVEQRLLWRLVETSGPDRDPAWRRAEQLAKDTDPSRAQVLGWVMTRSNASARAVPLLQTAMARLEDAVQQQRAAFTLLEAYLAVGDWKSAETVWPTARRRLTPDELPEWLGDIAVSAARDGAREDALRLWRQRTNFDRGSIEDLDSMLRAGLRQPLTEFYQSIAKTDPACQSVRRVQLHLQAAAAR